ncbi:MAG: diaminopimelate epimerase [Acidimicrobiia bacterium]|nr:diaminopimelate epimerase [Acidimicrobiia bacterium]
MAMLRVVKAHAYGNDFVFLERAEVARTIPGGDYAPLARAVCDRHRAVGADGLILYDYRERRASMQLYNADGSTAEISGNGLRCLAALVVHFQSLRPGASVMVDTTAGVRTLEFLERDGERFTFRAAMGRPDEIRHGLVQLEDETIGATLLSMGNPHCVVLGPLPDEQRFQAIGPALSTHEMFPAGTNVEFAFVETPELVRILIWERGVGPTHSSGTGTAAAAVAAVAHGGASRSVDVVAPGGTQHVEWKDEGVFLTGWAEVVLEGEWLDARS